MAGTKLGGELAAKSNKRKYGKDFYRRIGAMGGAASGTGGFYANREMARVAGAKGGRTSRRCKATAPSMKARYYNYSSYSNRWMVYFPGAPSRSFNSEEEAKAYVTKLRQGV